MHASRVFLLLVPWTLTLVTCLSAAHGLTIRGDHLWRGNPACPPGWNQPGTDDHSWSAVAFPWLLLWPKHWAHDPVARPFWEASGSRLACVRRRFEVPMPPSEPTTARVWVDDDYEFYLNGILVGATTDGTAELPGESYDVSSLVRVGNNLIALKLRDNVGDRGALFSLSLPGLPEEPFAWASPLHAAAPWLTLLALVCGASLAGLAVRHLRRDMTGFLERGPPIAWMMVAVVLAVVCQTLLFAGDLYSGHQHHPWARWNWPQLALGIGFFLTMVIIGSEPSGAQTPSRPKPYEIIALCGILAIATILRTYQLDSIPVGFFQDEAANANDALALLEASEIRIWSDSVGGRPTLFLYLLGACLHLFGSSYLTLKIAPVALAVSSVACVYAVGRLCFGPSAALWAAFFLAVSRWHIHYSRMAWEVNCVPFFSALGFALLMHGLTRKRLANASLLGAAIVLSLGLYTYAAYRAVPIAAAAFLTATALSSGRVVLHERRRALILAGIVAVLVAAPLAIFTWREPDRYWYRYNEVSLTEYMAYYETPLPWLHQIGKGFLSLNHEGDELIRHNLPYAPHLGVITGTLFLFGLATSARGGHGSRLLWSWFLTFLALASLTRDAPHATRYLGLLVPAVLFAGLGMSRILAQTREHVAAKLVPTSLAVCVLLSAAALNAYQYFLIEAQHPDADYKMNLIGRRFCEYLRQRDEVDVYWTPGMAFFAGGQCEFLAHGRYTPRDLDLDDLRRGLPTDGSPRAAAVVFGQEFLQTHPELTPAANGAPQVNLPGPPIIEQDRRGEALYYLYEFHRS